MPYIKQVLRGFLDNEYTALYQVLEEVPKDELAGALNYVISALIRDLYPKPKYKDCNEVMGVLECAKQEYYRKVVAPYEEQKIAENGDI